MGESDKGVIDGVVNHVESEAPTENLNGEGSLTAGFRVSDRAEFLLVESSTKATNGTVWRFVPPPSFVEAHITSRRRLDEMMARNPAWSSYGGLMEYVNRVLNGTLSVEEEVADIGNSEKKSDVILNADMNMCQDVIEEPTSASKIDVTAIAIDKGSYKSGSGCPGEGTDLNGKQHEKVADIGNSGKMSEVNLDAEPTAASKTDVTVMAIDSDSYKLDSSYLGKGTGLNGKQHEGVADIGNSKERSAANLNADMNTCQDVIEKRASTSEIYTKAIIIGKDLKKLDSGCLGEADLNGKQDVVSNGAVPIGKSANKGVNEVKADINIEEVNTVKADLETEEVNNVQADSETQQVNNVKADFQIKEVDIVRADVELTEVNSVKDDILIVKGHGGQYITEKEGEYYVSDLVWGKVKSHPWWPGQIFAPSAASDKAIKYFKRDSHLIAYFGDQSFAWNDVSKIKPFRMYFSQMEKQSSGDGFCHAVGCALDEVARRVELGLACPCLPQEVHDKIKFQVVANAGIREESSRRDGNDNLSTADTFSPGELVHFLESLADSPLSVTDRLQFVIKKAQVLAFNRWKGRFQLPTFAARGGLLEDTELSVKGKEKDSPEMMDGLIPGPGSAGAIGVPSRKRKSNALHGSRKKHIHLSGNEDLPRIEENWESPVISTSSLALWNDQKNSIKRTDRKTISSHKNSQTRMKRQKIQLSASAGDDVASQPNTSLRVGEGICRALKSVQMNARGGKPRVGSTSAVEGAGKSQELEVIPTSIPTPDGTLSKLILAAKNPMRGHFVMVPLVCWLRRFRNSICLEKSSEVAAEKHTGNHRNEQELDLDARDTFGHEGTEDSYWTDRIIQSYSQNQPVFEAKGSAVPVTGLEANTGLVVNLDSNKQRDAVMVDLDAENQSDVANKVSEGYSPTALVLKFADMNSVPPIETLNQIFSEFGPLDESETKISRKGKLARVIFKRAADAEAAFSSSGKYESFGPSLVKYRLDFDPALGKAHAT